VLSMPLTAVHRPVLSMPLTAVHRPVLSMPLTAVHTGLCAERASDRGEGTTHAL
jgi:hypothetical protein